MDGQIIRQTSSYRHGLVLGLTMAEIMLLLVFCLLIAMTAFLRAEQVKRIEAEEQLRTELIGTLKERQAAQATRLREARELELTAPLRRLPEVTDGLRAAAEAGDTGAIDEFWRELVEGQAMVAELKKSGLSTKEIRDRIEEIKALHENGIEVDAAVRNADVVGSINRVMPGATEATMPPQAIADAVERGLHQDGQYGRQWPPIISLSEAGGYNFKTGSAELSPVFQQELRASIADRIAALVKQYDVDVIEVVGHTDEQPHGERQSNLDYDLLPVLRNQMNIASLVPSDNAGLGLARAVSVVTVLRQNRALAGYRLIPLSGAQLIRTDETLDLGGTPGDDRDRRRIEIRLRKSVPHEPAVNPTLVRSPVAAPPDRKILRPPPRPYFPMRVPY